MSDTPLPAGVTTGEPVLLALYHCWGTWRGNRRYPRRQDVDPAGMPGLLENVMLIDVERPAAEPGEAARPVFRYRLIGTGVTFSAGYDLTGSSFDALPDPAFRAFCQTLFEHALVLGEPVSADGSRTLAGQRWSFDSILLPLSEDGRTIGTFLAALVYPKERNLGMRPHPHWNWHRS